MFLIFYIVLQDINYGAELKLRSSIIIYLHILYSVSIFIFFLLSDKIMRGAKFRRQIWNTSEIYETETDAEKPDGILVV